MSTYEPTTHPESTARLGTEDEHYLWRLPRRVKQHQRRIKRLQSTLAQWKAQSRSGLTPSKSA